MDNYISVVWIIWLGARAYGIFILSSCTSEELSRLILSQNCHWIVDLNIEVIHYE